MNAALKKIVIPALREMGFRGSYPHFYRERNGHIDLITFQFSMSGGKFVVEISYFDKNRLNTSLEEINIPNDCKAYYGNKTLRLGSSEKSKGDYWFVFDVVQLPFVDIYKRTAKSVVPLLKGQAEEWWRSKYIV